MHLVHLVHLHFPSVELCGTRKLRTRLRYIAPIWPIQVVIEPPFVDWLCWSQEGFRVEVDTMWCPYKDLWPSRQGIVQVGIKHGYGTPTPIRSLQILRHIIYLPTKGSWNTSSFCQGAMRPAGCSLESSNELKLNRSAWAISELQTNRTVRGQVKPSEFEAGRLVVTVHSVSSTASQAKSACLVFSYSGDNKHCLVNGYRLLLVLLFIGQNLQHFGFSGCASLILCSPLFFNLPFSRKHIRDSSR